MDVPNFALTRLAEVPLTTLTKYSLEQFCELQETLRNAQEACPGLPLLAMPGNLKVFK